MFSPLPDTPLTVADLVGLGYRLFRNQPRFLISQLFAPKLVAFAGWLLVDFATSEVLGGHFAVVNVMGIVLGLVLGVIGTWMLAHRSLAVVRVLDLPRQNWQDARRNAWNRRWEAFAAMFFGMLVPALVTGAILLAGFVVLGASEAIHNANAKMAIGAVLIAIELVAIVVSVCIVFLFFYLLFDILACEDLSGSALLARSFKMFGSCLFRGTWFVCFLLGLLLLVEAIVICPFELLPAANEVFHFAKADLLDYHQWPVWALVVYEVTTFASDLVLYCWGLLSQGLFYRDLRLRTEGTDIMRGLDRLTLG